MTIRRAVAEDVDALLPLVREFYAMDHHPYREARVRKALRPLLADDRHGLCWLVSGPEQPLGYAVATWGYSLESGGRDAVLDEIYLRRRGAGIGARLLARVLEACREHGAARIFLETEAHNDAVRRFYQRHGFRREDSIWMTRWLDEAPDV